MRIKERTGNIICVSGLANSGKSTASEMLYYLLNAWKPFRSYFWFKIFKKWPFKKNWEITAFAKPLKQSLSILLNKPLDWFEDRKNKELCFVDLTSLKIYPAHKAWSDLRLSENRFSKLIKSGEPMPTEYFLSVRQLMQYYGTEVIRKYIGDKTWINATLNNREKNLIVSDLRFKVEYEVVHDKKGIIIYINRDSAVPGTHASEREVLELKDANAFDYVVDNNGTMEDLYNNLKKVIYV